MSFEQAQLLSQCIHYCITVGFVFFVAIKNFNRIDALVIKVYSILLIWGALTYAFQGCPITFLENKISVIFYGKPFYPNYKYESSDFYFLSRKYEFYIPLIILFLYKFAKLKNRD